MRVRPFSHGVNTMRAMTPVLHEGSDPVFHPSHTVPELSRLGPAHQNKRRPVVRVWKLGLYCQNGFLKSPRFGKVSVQTFVEAAHQLRCRAVVDCPEADEKRGRSGVQKTASQSQ